MFFEQELIILEKRILFYQYQKNTKIYYVCDGDANFLTSHPSVGIISMFCKMLQHCEFIPSVLYSFIQLCCGELVPVMTEIYANTSLNRRFGAWVHEMFGPTPADTLLRIQHHQRVNNLNVIETEWRKAKIQQQFLITTKLISLYNLDKYPRRSDIFRILE